MTVNGMASCPIDLSVSLRLPASLDSLAPALDHVRERCDALGLGPEIRHRLELMLEELVVNVGSYAYPHAGGDLEIACGLAGSEIAPGGAVGRMVCLRLRDWGVAFDPLAATAPNNVADITARPVGGLGIHLVREMADHCAYARRDGCNEITACLRPGDQPAPERS